MNRCFPHDDDDQDCFLLHSHDEVGCVDCDAEYLTFETTVKEKEMIHSSGDPVAVVGGQDDDADQL